MNTFFKFLFISLLILTNSYSQKIPFNILKSQEFQDEFKKSNIVLTEKDADGNLLLVRFYDANGLKYKQGFYIETYDKNLKLIKDFDYEIKHPNSEKFNTVIGVTYFESKISIIEVFYDLNLKQYICQANCINNDYQVSKKELFRLSNDEVKKLGNFALEHNFYSRTKQLFHFDNSGDINSEIDTLNDSFFSFSQKFSMLKDEFVTNITMVTNESKTDFSIAIDFYGDKSELLKLYLFDSNLNKKFETEFKREVKDNKYFFQNIQVAPDGDAIYLLAKSYSKEFRKKEKGGKYQFELTKITSNNQESQIINPEEHYINSLKTIFRNNQLICLGFYSDINEDKYQGISYFSFNPKNLEVQKSKYNLFSEQFIIDKYGKKKDKGLKYLVLKKAFLTTNNDLVINAEEQYIIKSASFNQAAIGFGGSQFNYNYDDIICAKLNSDGELVWARNINKSQSTSDDESYISYSSINTNDSSYFFINTGEEIKKLSNDRIEFGQIRKNKSNLNVIQVNSNGDFDFQKILDDENSSVPFMVSKGLIIDKSVLFLGRKGKIKQLIKVTL
jgi:hypothetical protein